MNKIFFILIWYFFSIINISFAWLDVKLNIIPDNWFENIVIDETNTGKNLLFSIFQYVKNSLFDLLAIIAISAFIFIWAKLIMARWNPEEFKKALMHFIYAIIWLTVVAISWAAVKLVVSIDF